MAVVLVIVNAPSRAMDKHRAELIERFYEAFSRRDVDAVLELCHPEIEIYKDPNVVEMVAALTPRGSERVAQYLRGWLESWHMYKPTAVELREMGDDVVVFVDVQARGVGSNFDIEEKIADVFTFREGLIQRLRLHATREEALRDADAGR